MRVCIGERDGREVWLSHENGAAFLDGEPLALNVTDEELAIFQEEITGLPKSGDPGYLALLTACRETFVSNLLQKCADSACRAKLEPVLEAGREALKEYMESGQG